MFFFFPEGILLKHPVDGRLYHIRLGRHVEGSDDADWNFSIFAAIFSVVH